MTRTKQMLSIPIFHLLEFQTMVLTFSFNFTTIITYY